MRISRSGTAKTVRGAAEDHFAGEAWIEHLATPSDDVSVSVQSVYFTPGSLTDWHAHPKGQVLHIVAGEGRIQQRGGDVLALRAGDTVSAAPGEWHWHGATPDTSMTMFAVQPSDAAGSVVEWGDAVE